VVVATGAVLTTIGAPRPYADSRPLRIEQLQLDDPHEGEVLVEIEAAGICHSDLSVVNGDRVRPVPMLLGHEASGWVRAVGAHTPGLAPGDHVVLTFLPRCGECAACQTQGRIPCEPGSASNAAGELFSGGSRIHQGAQSVYHHLGVSVFSTFAVVDHRSLVKIPDDVPGDIAAVLGCAVLTGGGAVLNVAQPVPGDTVAVVGIGGVGLAAVLTALGLPDVEVMAIDPLVSKQQMALRVGAHAAMSPAEAIDAGVRATSVIECAGSAAAFETAVAVCAPGGLVAVTGLAAPTARASISPLELVAQAKTIIGSYLGSSVPALDIPRFISMWRAGKLPLEHLISDTVTLTDINECMDRLTDGAVLRQVISFAPGN
jgi:Zn-dependent alcohol dehydrogenase